MASSRRTSSDPRPASRTPPVRWLFGDQLGPHFSDDPDASDESDESDDVDRGERSILLIESHMVLRRRRFHRQKAHLVLSAMRHRAAELGDRVRYLTSDTYTEALHRVTEPLEVIQPTSWAAVNLVERLGQHRNIARLPARGYVTSREDFARWAHGRGRRRLLMEDFYRDSRTRLGVLMTGSRSAGEPEGGVWNLDHENREPPPKGATRLDVDEPWWPEEDHIDAAVRADLDRLARDGVQFVGEDGPRLFAATRAEALAALDWFVAHRLPLFGQYEDAMLSGDRWMAHSLLSAPMNLGLLDPVEVVHAAEEAYHRGDAPLASVEGFVRQVMGWRDYMWHLYWYLGEDYRKYNALGHHRTIPDWFDHLDPSGTDAACLSWALTSVRESGWAHHIPRLMVLGNYALQQGWSPQAMTDWYHRSFVDGYDWVMVTNVVGMGQHADGGIVATKPYVSGGAYIDTMSDFCGSCRFNPRVRVGEDACPFTAGYWRFLHRHRERFEQNPRMRRAVGGLDRLKDLDQLLADS